MKERLFSLARIPLVRETGLTLLSIALAFAVGTLIIWAAGFSITVVFTSLWRGAFGNRISVGQTLTQATPIVFTSLSFLLAFRCGLFNIGAEGQFYVGAISAAVVGVYLRAPAWLHVPLCLGAAGLAGSLWGWIPGILKAKRGVNEFVTTMMLSYVAIELTNYLVAPRGPLHDRAAWANQTVRIASTAALPRIMSPTQVSLALVIAGIAAVVVWYFLFRTPSGYELRAVGQNPQAAECGGIRTSRKLVLALTLAGVLAALGGAGEVLGNHGRFVAGISPGYGWDGIAGGLIARAHPIAAVFAGLLIGALRAGGMAVQSRIRGAGDIALVLQGLVIFFVIAPTLIRYLLSLAPETAQSVRRRVAGLVGRKGRTV